MICRLAMSSTGSEMKPVRPLMCYRTAPSVGHETKELQWGLAGISELVRFVGWYKDHVAAAERVFDVPFQHDAVPFKHEYFVLERVIVFRRIASRRHLELPHREMGSTVFVTDQPPYLATNGTFHVNRLLSYLFVMVYLHGLHQLVET